MFMCERVGRRRGGGMSSIPSSSSTDLPARMGWEWGWGGLASRGMVRMVVGMARLPVVHWGMHGLCLAMRD